MTAVNPPWDINTPEGRAAAKLWLDNHMLALPDNTIWMIPRAASAYIVDKRLRWLIRQFGPGDPSTEELAEELGWKILTPNF